MRSDELTLGGRGTMATRTPHILIDEPEDGYIGQLAWVEVTTDVTPEKAVELIEREWPTEDRGEEERYVCEGQTEWHKPRNPANTNPDEDYWDPAVAGEEHAMLFWVVKVVCSA